MKTTLFYLTFFLFFISHIGFSQITVNASDFFTDGDIFYKCNSNYLTTNITPGPNKTWNYSNLDTLRFRTKIPYLLPSATNYGAVFPISNIAEIGFGDSTDIRYYQKTSSKLEEVGYYYNAGVTEIYSNTKTLYHFPIVYTDNYSDDFKSEHKIFGPAIMSSSDSIKYITTGERNYKVDSWGDLILPTGTFEALRISDTTIVLIEEKHLNSGIWTSISSQRDTFYSNSFVSNNPHAQNELLIQNLDAYGNVTNNYWNDVTPGFVSIAEKEKSFSFNLFPNPTSNLLTINSKDAIKSYVIRNISGQIIEQKNLSNVSEINVSKLPSGLYLLTLKNKNGQSSQRFVKQ